MVPQHIGNNMCGGLMSGQLERVLQDPDVSASQVMEHLGDLASMSLKIFLICSGIGKC